MRYFTGKSETFDPLLVLDEKSRNDIHPPCPEDLYLLNSSVIFQQITTVIIIHSVGNMNLCIIFHGNSSNSCQDIYQNTKVILHGGPIGSIT